MKLPFIDLEKIENLAQAKNVIEQLLSLYSKQQEEIALLRTEINRLKGQPKKPIFPFSDKGKSASVTGFLKEKGSWHKTSKKGRVAIDRDEQLEEVVQCTCGNTTFKTLRTTQKIIQGLYFKRDNVAYHGRVKECTSCSKTYKSHLSQELAKISFSPELSSFLSFFKYSCRVTQPLILRTLQGMGIQISSGQVSNLLMENGGKLMKADQELRTAGIKNSPHLQSDASGAKRKDKKTGRVINQYVQIVSNKLLSIFSITKHYNAKTLNRLLTKAGRNKLFVSDDGSPNGDSLEVKLKQLCVVHEIRHYKKLFPFFNNHQKEQKQILKQWQVFYHLAKHYKDAPPNQRVAKREEIEKLFDQITSQITAYEDLDKQLRLTKKKKERLLLFLSHPELPIHNNQCEQDIRQFVIIRKISGATKSFRGDKSLARHLSVIQTAQKQGLDVYKTLHGLLTGTLSPAILTANIC